MSNARKKDKRNQKDENLIVLQASILRALAHPIRLKIVKCLLKGERCVNDIVACVGSGRSNVSRHIAVLLNAEILGRRKSGLNIFYRLTLRCALNFLTCSEKAVRQQMKLRMAALRGG